MVGKRRAPARFKPVEGDSAARAARMLADLISARVAGPECQFAALRRLRPLSEQLRPVKAYGVAAHVPKTLICPTNVGI